MSHSAIMRSVKNLTIKDWVATGVFTLTMIIQAVVLYFSLKMAIERNEFQIEYLAIKTSYEYSVLSANIQTSSENLRDDIGEIRKILMTK